MVLRSVSMAIRNEAWVCSIARSVTLGPGAPGGQRAAAPGFPSTDDVATTDLYEAARKAVLPGFLTLVAVVEQVRELDELEADDKRSSEVVAAVADLDRQGVVARMSRMPACRNPGPSKLLSSTSSEAQSGRRF